MRASAIIVGKSYENGKKRQTIRKVLKIAPGPDGILAVIFEEIKAPKNRQGLRFCITLRSFVSWAKAEI